MSEAPPQTPDATSNDGLTKVAEQWAQIRMAHEAVMLEDAQEVLRQSRKSVASLPGQLGLSETPLDEGMGVHIGDVINYVTPTEKTTERSVVSSTVEKPSSVVADVASRVAAVVPQAAPVATPKPSILPSLLKIGLGAVMAGTGVGLPFALPSIISGVGGLFSRAEPAAVVQPETGSDSPSVIINGEAYELSLEGGEKDE